MIHQHLSNTFQNMYSHPQIFPFFFLQAFTQLLSRYSQLHQLSPSQNAAIKYPYNTIMHNTIIYYTIIHKTIIYNIIIYNTIIHNTIIYLQPILQETSIAKKGICHNLLSMHCPCFGLFGVWGFFEPPWLGWGMELVRNSAIYHSMGPLSLHGLSFSLCSLKRAEASRPMRAQEVGARPIRELDSLNSPPIVWPSVLGPSRREQGGTMPCKRQKSKKTKY